LVEKEFFREESEFKQQQKKSDIFVPEQSSEATRGVFSSFSKQRVEKDNYLRD